MSRILITGATGLLGRDLLPLAIDARYEVRVLPKNFWNFIPCLFL